MYMRVGVILRYVQRPDSRPQTAQSLFAFGAVAVFIISRLNRLEISIYSIRIRNPHPHPPFFIVYPLFVAVADYIIQTPAMNMQTHST
jgi:hypothetical protein